MYLYFSSLVVISCAQDDLLFCLHPLRIQHIMVVGWREWLSGPGNSGGVAAGSGNGGEGVVVDVPAGADHGGGCGFWEVAMAGVAAEVGDQNL
ncbi:hypothetical protein U1Q18_019408 [Sarracenia purpurea var. burkii]